MSEPLDTRLPTAPEPIELSLRIAEKVEQGQLLFKETKLKIERIGSAPALKGTRMVTAAEGIVNLNNLMRLIAGWVGLDWETDAHPALAQLREWRQKLIQEIEAVPHA